MVLNIPIQLPISCENKMCLRTGSTLLSSYLFLFPRPSLGRIHNFSHPGYSIISRARFELLTLGVFCLQHYVKMAFIFNFYEKQFSWLNLTRTTTRVVFHQTNVLFQSKMNNNSLQWEGFLLIAKNANCKKKI